MFVLQNWSCMDKLIENEKKNAIYFFIELHLHDYLSLNAYSIRLFRIVNKIKWNCLNALKTKMKSD